MTVLTKTFEAPPISRREILRFAGVRGESHEINALLEECLREISGLCYRVCYAELPVDALNPASRDLRKTLEGCGSAVVFAATVGIAIDRLISRYSAVSQTKALLFQAIGAERIESLCDAFQCYIAREAQQRDCISRPRFSPGYGDLPLEFQREIFAILDCPKHIGLTLNNSLLMSPSKSVTAIIGIGKE